MQPKDVNERSTNDLEKRLKARSTLTETHSSEDVQTDTPFPQWEGAGYPDDMFDFSSDDIVAVTNVSQSPLRPEVKLHSSITSKLSGKDSPQNDSSDSEPLSGNRRIPSPLEPVSEQHSAARDGFNESSDIVEYGLSWVSDDAWPKKKICKRSSKKHRCKQIEALIKQQRRLLKKPYDKKVTEGVSGWAGIVKGGGVIHSKKANQIKEGNTVPSCSIQRNPNEEKYYEFFDRPRTADSSQDSQEPTPKAVLTENCLKWTSFNASPSNNRSNEVKSFELLERPCIANSNQETLDSTPSATLAENCLKCTSFVASSLNNLSNSNEPLTLAGYDNSQSFIETSTTNSENSPKEQKITQKLERKKTRPHKRNRTLTDSDSSKSYEKHYNVNWHESKDTETPSPRMSSNVSSEIANGISGSCGVTSGSKAYETTASPTYSQEPTAAKRSSISSTESLSDEDNYFISEPNSREKSTGTINLKISEAFFSDSSPDSSSSPTLTSPILLSKKTLPENNVYSPTVSNTHLLQQSVDAMRAAYEERLENQKKIDMAVEELNYNPNTSWYSGHAIENRCRENSPYISWSPSEFHSNFYGFTPSPNLRVCEVDKVEDNDEDNIVIHKTGGKGYAPCSPDIHSPRSISKGLSSTDIDSDGVYSPKSSDIPEYYYHNVDPLGLSLQSSVVVGRDSVTPSDTFCTRWPDTPRPEFYYPHPGFYSYWEGPGEPNTPRSSNNGVVPGYLTAEGILDSQYYVDAHTSPREIIVSDQETRLEVCHLAETIEYIRHQETVLLDTVDKLQSERWVLEGRLCSLIENPANEDGGGSMKEFVNYKYT